MDLFFRQGTQDEDIWKSIFDHDEYGLAAIPLGPADVVLDIGAHIGSFSYSALHRGAGLCVAVEADTENCRIFRHNLHAACEAGHRAVLLNGAAWRSDGTVGTLHLVGANENTGGGNVLGEAGLLVRAIPFDALLALAVSMSASGRVRLVKLDCEGAEWPILKTTDALHLVDEIVGEYHETHDAEADPSRSRSSDAKTLRNLLESAGFEVFITPTAGGLGLFHAQRRSRTGAPV